MGSAPAPAPAPVSVPVPDWVGLSVVSAWGMWAPAERDKAWRERVCARRAHLLCHHRRALVLRGGVCEAMEGGLASCRQGLFTSCARAPRDDHAAIARP